MHDISFTDPCVVFALRREAMYFRRDFPPDQTLPGGPCRAWFCGPTWLPVLTLETGVGAAAMEAALQWLLARPIYGNVPVRPKLILSAGYSGALRPGQRVGDLILATEVADADGNVWPTSWPGELPPGDWRPPLWRGRILTVTELAADPREKQRLGERHQALAADMECAVIARLCHKNNVPFGCLRVISDAVETRITAQLLDVLKRGTISPGRLGALLLRRPWLIGELWRLAGASRVASRQLGRALGEVLTLTLPWMEDEGNEAGEG